MSELQNESLADSMPSSSDHHTVSSTKSIGTETSGDKKRRHRNKDRDGKSQREHSRLKSHESKSRSRRLEGKQGSSASVTSKESSRSGRSRRDQSNKSRKSPSSSRLERSRSGGSIASVTSNKSSRSRQIRRDQSDKSLARSRSTRGSSGELSIKSYSSNRSKNSSSGDISIKSHNSGLSSTNTASTMSPESRKVKLGLEGLGLTHMSDKSSKTRRAREDAEAKKRGRRDARSRSPVPGARSVDSKSGGRSRSRDELSKKSRSGSRPTTPGIENVSIHGRDKGREKAKRSERPGIENVSRHRDKGREKTKRSARSRSPRPGVEGKHNDTNLVASNIAGEDEHTVQAEMVEEVDEAARKEQEAARIKKMVEQEAARIADERDREAARQREEEKRRQDEIASDSTLFVSWWRRNSICLVVVLILLIGGGIGAFFALKGGGGEDPNATASPVVNATSAPMSDLTSSPTSTPTSSPTVASLFDPPSDADCEAMKKGEAVLNQGKMKEYTFALGMDVWFSLDIDFENVYLPDLEEAIQEYLAPYLAQCPSIIRRKLRSGEDPNRFVIGNAIVSVEHNKDEACKENAGSACFSISVTLRVFLKAEIDKVVLRVTTFVAEAFGKAPIVQLLQLTAPYVKIVLISVDGLNPTDAPTPSPSVAPVIDTTITEQPTGTTSSTPSVAPVSGPTTEAPTKKPTMVPSIAPTIAPTKPPTIAPTMAPVVGPTPPPTQAPTSAPTKFPTPTPTALPTMLPSKVPSAMPTEQLSQRPSSVPSVSPTTSYPSASPSYYPTASPTLMPALITTTSGAQAKMSSQYFCDEPMCPNGQSTLPYSPASKAIDGNTDGNHYSGQSMSHTWKEYNPWWRVDFSSAKDVVQVVVWNRVDCCEDIIIGSDVELLDENDNVLASSPITTGDQSTVHDFGSAVSGVKSVRVMQKKDDAWYYMWLAEVQVFGLNSEDLVATDSGAVAWQSSEYYCAITCPGGIWYNLGLPAAPAERAIDGNFDQAWAGGGIIHTAWQNFPWWMVELGFNATVHRVKVWNRSDYQENMLKTFLELLDNTGQVLHSQEITTVENVYTFEYPGGVAGVSALRLAKYHRQPEFIYFAEFEAFGYRT